MNRKWLIRIVAIVMAAVMALSVIYVIVDSVTAGAVVTQSEIDKLKKHQKENEKKMKELQSTINSLKYQQSSALEKKKVLDQQLILTQDQIDLITEQIAEYDKLIAEKTIEVQIAQANEDKQWARFKANMRQMEENGAITYISVIFQADSFADMLSRINDIGALMEHDQKLYEQLKADKLATARAKAALQKAREEQAADKAELDLRRADLQTQLEESNALLKKLEEDIEATRELLNQEEKEAERIQKEINKKTEELKKQNQGKGAVKGTGQFIWPAPSSRTVTSKFGMRKHPVLGEYRMHTGIDIGASYGTNVDAADAGMVIISDYSSSYGHYIVIDHGNGYTTLYAHLSKRLVKAGDKVKQGAIIGKVGSTGLSTGPHLHFEISKNGTRINPAQFYTGLTYTASA